MAMSDVEELLKVRGEQYGNSWKVTGEIVQSLGIPTLAAVTYLGYLFNWMMILNKIIRILYNPSEKDHWMDIAGYATLVVKDIEKHEPVKGCVVEEEEKQYIQPVLHSGGDNVHNNPHV